MPRARSAAKLRSERLVPCAGLGQLRDARCTRSVAWPDSLSPASSLANGLTGAGGPRDPPLHEQRPFRRQDRLTGPGDVALLLSQRRIPPGQRAAISQQRPQVRAAPPAKASGRESGVVRAAGPPASSTSPGRKTTASHRPIAAVSRRSSTLSTAIRFFRPEARKVAVSDPAASPSNTASTWNPAAVESDQLRIGRAAK